jgi:uncharacterized membrane protein YjjB (DUF3815 family)
VFLPGAALTTAVLELAAGQMVSGASRLVSGCVQLGLLAFGILAGIEAVNLPASRVLFSTEDLLGPWAPWLGVLVFAVGVVVAYSAPTRAFPALLIVLYAAWIAQFATNSVFGGYVSALVGAAVMTPVAQYVARLPSAMPAHASFLPGFWLLVPGALGLIGLTELAGGAGGQDLVATVGSIFAVALGVLCGTQLIEWASLTGRAVRRRVPLTRVVGSGREVEQSSKEQSSKEQSSKEQPWKSSRTSRRRKARPSGSPETCGSTRSPGGRRRLDWP